MSLLFKCPTSGGDLLWNPDPIADTHPVTGDSGYGYFLCPDDWTGTLYDEIQTAHGSIPDLKDTVVYLVSIERKFDRVYTAFWKQSKLGYTCDIREAGKFSTAFAADLIAKQLGHSKGMELAFFTDDIIDMSTENVVFGESGIPSIELSKLDISKAAIRLKGHDYTLKA